MTHDEQRVGRGGGRHGLVHGRWLLLTGLALALGLSGSGRAAHAQGDGSGGQRLRVGDLVDVVAAGETRHGMIVGAYQQTEFGYGTYQVHLDGEKYCNNHALDTRVNANFVFPRKGVPAREEGPAPAPANPHADGMYRVGESVIYRSGGPLWWPDASVESYDAEKRAYTIRDKSGSGDIVPCHSVSRPGRADNGFFVGDWEVFVSSSTSTFERGGDRYRRFGGGMKLPPLQIRVDGTYTWRDSGGKRVEGRWVPREGVPGITILGGPDGKDWTVYENTEGAAPTAKTRDEIRFHHLPTSTGYYVAYRVGVNKSCVLAGRTFGQ